MNYQITEDELNQLQSVRGQIGLVEGLLCANGADSNLFNATDLYEFLAAQTATLLRTIKGIEQRQELMRDAPQVTAPDLAHMIRILRGKESNTPTGSEIRITDALVKCAAIDESMQMPLDAWLDALVDMGEEQRTAAVKAAPVKPATPRKRERLVATAGAA